MNHYYRDSHGTSLIKILVTVLSLAVVSFGAAFFWQRAEDSTIAFASGNESSTAADKQESSSSDASAQDEEYKDIDMSEDALAKAAPASSAEISSESSGDEASSGEDSAAEDDSPTSSRYARDAIPGSLPFSKPVGFGYFDDAIFFGDSISTGIPLYMQTMVPNTAVIAAQGVSPGGALTSECINTASGRVTMLQAAKAKGERKKVYIMLGANALDYDEEPFIKGYIEFLQAVKLQYPEAVIYIQSMLPVTSNVNQRYPSKNINNERISSYNNLICKMALDAGVNYVDVAQGVVDENGMLPTAASPHDGMHVSAEYYMKWFDYLRNHTVSAKK